MIPQLEWKICIGDAQPADEVVFEGLDGMFSGADTMVVGFYKLEAALLLLQVLTDGFAGLIICDAEGRLVSSITECLEDLFVGGNNVVIGSGGNGDGEDVIGIVGIRDEE